MSGSTNVEKKNNAYVACTEVKPIEKENELSIEIGNHGQKGQDKEYEIRIIEGKIVTPDDKAKPLLEEYKKNRAEDVKKYGKSQKESEDRKGKDDEEPQI